jgi:hypothetical protein
LQERTPANRSFDFLKFAAFHFAHMVAEPVSSTMALHAVCLR